MIELGTAVSVRDVKVDTSTNRDIVLVATDSGLYRSADEGDTYSAIPTFAGMSVWSIVRTSAGWLASAQPCAAANVGLRAACRRRSILSTDRGATWAPITNAGGVFTANGRTTLGVAVPGDSVVYAYSSTVDDAAMKDVYRSTDGGQTWVANGVNSTKIPTNPVPPAQHQHEHLPRPVLVQPDGPRRPDGHVAQHGLDRRRPRRRRAPRTAAPPGRSRPGGSPARSRRFPYAHADHHAAAFKTTGTPTIILGNDGGLNISKTTARRSAATRTTAWRRTSTTRSPATPTFPNLVIGGTQDNGTRLRTDNSTIHNQVNRRRRHGRRVQPGEHEHRHRQLAGLGHAHEPQQQRRRTSSRTGSPRPPALLDVGFGFFTAIVPAPAGLDPTGRVFFHFSNARVWRSNNGGLSWILDRLGRRRATSPGLPPARRFRSSPYNLGVSPTDLTASRWAPPAASSTSPPTAARPGPTSTSSRLCRATRASSPT